MDLIHAIEGGSLLLERRSSRGGRRLRGRFPYNKRAVLSDGGRNGRPQKEEFAPRAFSYRIEKPDEEIHLLVGHDYGQPLASKSNGTLRFRDTEKELQIEADIAEDLLEVTHVRNALALLAAGLMVGLSPGFRMPPERAVAKQDAEEWIDEDYEPEKGNHRAQIRRIKQALLYEVSLVTNPAYKDASAEPPIPRSQPDSRIIPVRQRLIHMR